MLGLTYYGLFSVIVIGVCINNVHAVAETTKANYLESTLDRNFNQSSCYAIAVYNELMKAIKLIESRYGNADDVESEDPEVVSPLFKKFQEDEDYGGEGGGGGGVAGALGGLDIPPIVPTIFKIVGSAFRLNSSGAVDSSLGFIPPRLSGSLTSVLGSLANGILGIPPRPPTPRPNAPPRRRRRTTTEATTALNGTDSSNSTSNMEESMSNLNGGSENDGTTESPDSTSKKALFHASSLGETPIYASAYAPNYVATTTFPVYANKFLHVLYPAPTTPTTPTPPPTTRAAKTTTDQNFYAVELPFQPIPEVKDSSLASQESSSPLFSLESSAPSSSSKESSPPSLSSKESSPPSFSSKESSPPTFSSKETFSLAPLYSSKESSSFPPQLSSEFIASTSSSNRQPITFYPNIATTPMTDYEEYEYEDRTQEAAKADTGRQLSSSEDKNQKKLVTIKPTTVKPDKSKGLLRNEDEDDEYIHVENESYYSNHSLGSLGRISRSSS